MIILKPDDIFSKLYPAQNVKQKKQSVCENKSPFPSKTPLAMSYIYFQQWGDTFSPDVALQNGTLFPDLDKPFERGAVR